MGRVRFLNRFYGAVAQLGERLVRNEEVSGSIPLSSTIKSTTYEANEGTISSLKLPRNDKGTLGRFNS